MVLQKTSGRWPVPVTPDCNPSQLLRRWRSGRSWRARRKVSETPSQQISWAVVVCLWSQLFMPRGIDRRMAVQASPSQQKCTKPWVQTPVQQKKGGKKNRFQGLSEIPWQLGGGYFLYVHEQTSYCSGYVGSFYK
jgi:hypothetical protein